MKVAAKNKAVPEWSDWATATGTPHRKPDPPTLDSATPGCDSGNKPQIALAWTAPANDGGSAVTDYRFSYGSGATLLVDDETKRSATITGLTASTSYTVTAQAKNKAGWSPSSASVTATTLGCTSSVGGSLAVSPATVAENAGATSIDVTLAVDSPPAVDTDVTLTVGDGTGSAAAGTDYRGVAAKQVTIGAGLDKASTSFTLTPLDNTRCDGDRTIGMSFIYNGNTISATVTITDDDTCTPLMLALAGDCDAGAAVAASWEESSSTSPTAGYTVEYKQSTASAWTSEGTIRALSHTITGLTGGAAYTVRVTALDGTGQNRPGRDHTRVPARPADAGQRHPGLHQRQQAPDRAGLDGARR